MSYYILTFRMCLKNIAKVVGFTKLVHKQLPVEIREHICVKKALDSKNRNIFDFMLYPPNDEVPVIDSLILEIPKELVKNSKADNGTIGAKVDYVEKLLNIMNIKGFDVLYPTSVYIFTLRCITESYCPLYQDIPKGIKKPSLKLIINKNIKNQEKTSPPL
ncbi:3410_t:CDS:2 [Cetraspora pellucida]|uniref:3410_t:CDS:1 n=1 Tax=Cetraspora pellucida TaxID=1433469 RepID=A0A9N8WL17_9GLOM|nr:3410_t:CDS:2 [Cetraspora pellucida]